MEEIKNKKFMKQKIPKGCSKDCIKNNWHDLSCPNRVKKNKKEEQETLFQFYNKDLQRIVAEIPMTEDQNSEIHSLIDSLEEVFRGANNYKVF